MAEVVVYPKEDVDALLASINQKLDELENRIAALETTIKPIPQNVKDAIATLINAAKQPLTQAEIDALDTINNWIQTQ